MAVYGEDEIPYPIDDKNQEVYTRISNLVNHNRYDEANDTEEFLQKYTSTKREKLSKDLNIYCCAICGRNCILVNARMERLPTRRTDLTIIVDTQKYTTKHYFKNGSKPFAIQRENGLDVIVEFLCQCDAPIGYFCLNDLTNVKAICENTDTRGMNEKEKVMFIYPDSIVMDSKNALVFSELASLKFSATSRPT